MPITDDVKLFLQFLTDEITKYVKLLNQTQTLDLWSNLRWESGETVKIPLDIKLGLTKENWHRCR